MKKIRGKRRYFRNMWREIHTYDLQIDNEIWFSFSHHHLDFYGYGKSSLKLRRQHIIGHLALLDYNLQQLEQFEKPFQAWINLNETYPEYDAVYIHSENPYDAFPFQLSTLQPVREMPKAYADLIDLSKYDVMYGKENEQVSYVVQVKEKGISISNGNKI